MNNLWIWSVGGKLFTGSSYHVIETEVFEFLGSSFAYFNSDLGDADLLLNNQGKVVGVAFTLSSDLPRQNVVIQRILTSTEWAVSDGEMLYILLNDDRNYDVNVAQIMFSEIYFHDDDFLLCIPMHGWPELAFQANPI